MKLFKSLAQMALLAVCAFAFISEGKADEKQKNLYQEYVQKYGQPGPEHKVLEQMVGTWDAKVKCWFDPQQPEQSTGTAVRKSILGGRFIHEEFDGKMMDRPFQGIGIVGYDVAKKKYEMIWLDSVSTAIMHSAGTFDEPTKTFVFTHEGTCPITGKHLKMRNVLRLVSADEEKMEMFRQLGDEKEMKAIEITFTRKK